MKRYLGLSKKNLLKTKDYGAKRMMKYSSSTDAGGELRGAGVSGAGIDADMAGMDEEVPGVKHH